MGTFAWQTWNSAPFKIERKRGKTPGTVILSLSGPFTVRDVYSVLPTMELNKMLDLPSEPGEDPPAKKHSGLDRLSLYGFLRRGHSGDTLRTLPAQGHQDDCRGSESARA